MLTLVAFKFVTNAFLPIISYLTVLDCYMIIATVLTFVCVLENFIVSKLFFSQITTDDGSILENPTALYIDVRFAIVFTVVWFLLHVIIIIGHINHWFYADWNKVRTENNEEVTKLGMGINFDVAAEELPVEKTKRDSLKSMLPLALQHNSYTSIITPLHLPAGTTFFQFLQTRAQQNWHLKKLPARS